MVILIISSIKLGREKTLIFAIKVVSPIFIILFYLSGFSIIEPIVNKLNITNSIVNTSPSIRVAIDSAIVTLFVNTFLMFINAPIEVKVEAKNRQDLEQVVTYCKRNINVDYTICVNYRYKWVKKMLKKLNSPYLYIVNSRNTSISVDKKDEYENIINSKNASQYIIINLTKLSDSDVTEDKLYFSLAVVSNKTVKWDSEIYTKIFIKNKPINLIHKLFWEHKDERLKLVHREESL